MIKAVRGTRDLLPPETALWNFVEAAVRDVFRAYNFHEIRTPVIEDLQLFQRSVGEETDIVSKEMFTLPAKSKRTTVKPAGTETLAEPLMPEPQESEYERAEEGQMLALRPENTAGVVRAYIEHKLWERPGLQRLYYIGPQFRRERPQKGRYRQFYQIGAEVIGPPSADSERPLRDAEVLEMLATLLDRLGITGWTLELNSVGCAHDRPKFNAALREALEGTIAKMCADCQRRARTNPLRVFDCKVPKDQPIIANLPRMAHFLDDACREHFQDVQALLHAARVPFKLNTRLVRGLDYYTRTAFEFTHGALGSQNAILGGGRYDGLSEALGGPKAPGIGFAIGEDRLVMALEDVATGIFRAPDVYIAPVGEGMNLEGLRLAQELRRHDLVVELGDRSSRMKKLLETASKLGARFAVIVGENEVKSGTFAVKNLGTGEQVSVPRAELAKTILSSR